MATRTITRLASAAVVTSIASLALAAPASARFPTDPVPKGEGSNDAGTRIVLVEDGWELAQVATGALGGIALAGLGVVAAAGLRRHGHMAHPA